MFWLATVFVNGFIVDTFWWAILGAILVSVISAVADRMVLGKDGKVGGE
jgi:uncharacterized membrane protein YvlD (DUF360 family)